MKDEIKNEVDKLPNNILAKASQDLSATSFQKIWDNEEDAVYDNL